MDSLKLCCFCSFLLVKWRSIFFRITNEKTFQEKWVSPKLAPIAAVMPWRETEGYLSGKRDRSQIEPNPFASKKNLIKGTIFDFIEGRISPVHLKTRP